jgi:hypothetical protein
VTAFCAVCVQQDMRDICTRLGVRDLRRTFCSKVTELGFGRHGRNLPSLSEK